MFIKIKNDYYMLQRKSLTFNLTIYNIKTDIAKEYWLQISTKDPWFKPKRDTVCNGKITLWGWLFFYVGCNTDMLIK